LAKAARGGDPARWAHHISCRCSSHTGPNPPVVERDEYSQRPATEASGCCPPAACCFFQKASCHTGLTRGRRWRFVHEQGVRGRACLPARFGIPASMEAGARPRKARTSFVDITNIGDDCDQPTVYLSEPLSLSAGQGHGWSPTSTPSQLSRLPILAAEVPAGSCGALPQAWEAFLFVCPPSPIQAATCVASLASGRRACCCHVSASSALGDALRGRVL
jgi:hypothetical protein